MLKKIPLLVFCFFFINSVANALHCPKATPTSDPNFCSSFFNSASCYCSNSLPQSMCKDMNLIYQRIISFYGSIEMACKIQVETSAQECLDDWKCYRSGGKNSQGGLCSGTGKSCQA